MTFVGISKHSNHRRLKIGGSGKQKNFLSFFCDVLWIPNVAESFSDEILHHGSCNSLLSDFNKKSQYMCNCVPKIAKYGHFCSKNHNKRASKFCTFFRPFCTGCFLVDGRDQSRHLEILGGPVEIL